MPGRSYIGSSSYRYGFNGKENDNEVKGNGNQQDYGMRIYDPRLGKFLSVDPITKNYPGLTPYQFASNTPIQAIDLDGLEAFFVGGTWQASASLGYNAWGGTDSRPSQRMVDIQKSFGNTSSQHLHWSGNNNKFARKVDAYTIAKQVYDAHVKSGGKEPITLVGHSHGGNVMIEVANILYTDYNLKVDNLLTVNTPVISAHKLNPNLKKSIKHYQIFNSHDLIQISGNGNSSATPEEGKSRIKARYDEGKDIMTGEMFTGGAGRKFPDATKNIEYVHATDMFDGDPGHHMGNWSQNVARWLPTLQEAIAKNKAEATKTGK